MQFKRGTYLHSELKLRANYANKLCRRARDWLALYFLSQFERQKSLDSPNDIVRHFAGDPNNGVKYSSGI